MLRQILMILVGSVSSFAVFAQVTLDPYFASQNDVVTVTYDASLGNGELDGVSEVYAHTGVITDQSTGPNDWRHVVGVWGTPDPQVAMVNQGNNIHTFVIDIDNFYPLNSGEQVERLAFVFRNADGSLVGRAVDGSDIFVDLFTGGFAAELTTPSASDILLVNHQNLDLNAQSSAACNLSLYVDDSLLVSSSGVTSLSHSMNTQDFGSGKHFIWMEADNGQEIIRDSIYYLFHASPTIASLPAGTEDGINYLSDTSVRLSFAVPFKNFIYVIGDFNNWELDEAFLMNKTADNNTHWIDINGLEPGKEYRFQYLVDQEQIRVADIFSRKILDPWNDQWIDDETYPDLIPYPHGKTTQPVGVLQTAQSPFLWDEGNYQRPDQKDLVIYELLVRDFVQEHDYQTVIDSLDYLQKLGINAIELMPFNEFEGNESWGYNPSFYFAPDKYYGTADDLKTFIQECHQRGIAVIMDMVLNHSFGQSPQVRLFFDPSVGQYGQPTAQNPWFLQTAAHDFNVGYDYNHESSATKKFVDQVMRYWIEEFHVDGYRMDLSKGFTSNVTIGNVGAWGNYDASRVAILKRMADEVWSFDENAYIILEHFADNDEERELANYGFMLWGNMNHSYTEASMGFGDDLSWIAHTTRGWNEPHVVGYAESHDEERLMYKNLEFGKVEPDYSIQELNTALKRAELSAVFLLGVPGPKMLWQFGEYGYDYSINHCPDGTISEACRLSNKPIRWDYLENGNRKRLFDVYAAMIDLHINHPTFKTSDFDLELSAQTKTIRLNHSEMNAVIIGNFDVATKNIRPNFQHTGTWYEYFSGDSIEVDEVDELYSLPPGTYKIYTDQRLEQPDIAAGSYAIPSSEIKIFPNPSNDRVTISMGQQRIETIRLINMQGQELLQQTVQANQITLPTSTLANGAYILEFSGEEIIEHQTLIIQH